MIKKLVLKLSVLLMLFSIMTAGQANALSIDLEISDTDINIGENFSIDVWVNDASVFGDEIIAFGFDITNSNNSVVNTIDWSVAIPFDDDSGFFPSTDVAGSIFPGLIDDSILLATLNFSALDEGNVTLGIFSDLGDFNEGLVYLWQGNQDITSTLDITISSAPAPIPEPSTILLVSCGLIGMVGLRKKVTVIKDKSNKAKIKLCKIMA